MTEWETGNSGQRWERVSRCLEKLEPVKVTTHNTSPTLTVHNSLAIVSLVSLFSLKGAQCDGWNMTLLPRTGHAPPRAGWSHHRGDTQPTADCAQPGRGGSQHRPHRRAQLYLARSAQCWLPGWWHGPRHNRLGWSEQLCRGNTDPAQIHEQTHFCSVSCSMLRAL